jgi:hypothetical protein
MRAGHLKYDGLSKTPNSPGNALRRRLAIPVRREVPGSLSGRNKHAEAPRCQAQQPGLTKRGSGSAALIGFAPVSLSWQLGFDVERRDATCRVLMR